MRRLVASVFVLSAAVALPGLAGNARELLADVDTFRVRSVVVEGTRYLPDGRVESAMELRPGASVWDDPAPIERAVGALALVRAVEIRRRLPSTLVVRIEERSPVALLATPTLEPVDAEGRTIPLDPAVHRLDLPLLRVATGRAPRAAAAEVARLGREEPSFVALLSELTWRESGEAVARWGDPAVDIRYRPPLSVGRLRRAMTVVADASARRPSARVSSVDLRWADQVVVRYGEGGSA